jgi:heme exporter protein D
MDHFWFIAGSYVTSALVLVGIVAWVVTDGRTVARRLRELDERGIRRRSQAAAGRARPK